MELYNENMLSRIKQIESESIDLIVTDPPYSITSRGNCGNMSGYWVEKQSMSGNLFKAEIPKITDYIADFERILKNGSHFYIMTNHINLIEYLNAIENTPNLHFTKCLIWDKVKKINGQMYMGQFEYVLFGRKRGDFKPINDCGSSDIISIPIKKMKYADGRNMHNTEKPTKLMEYFIKNSSQEGEVVLDPFMGIGASGVACKNLNRNFIGIEIEKTYFDIAKARIEEHCVNIDNQQLTLF